MATNPSQSAQGANTNEALTGSESIKAYVRLKPFGADGSEELPVLDQVEQNKVIDKEHNQTYEFGSVLSQSETVFGMQDNNQAVFDEVIGKNWELIRRGTKSTNFK